MQDRTIEVKAIEQALGDTFEGMAFVTLIRDEDAVPPQDDGVDWHWARVDVLSPRAGYFLVAGPERMMRDIACSMYGQYDCSPSQTEMLDMLGEMVNTFAGRCLNILVPDESTFSLGLPEKGVVWPDTQDGTVVGFVTPDENRVFVAFRLDGCAA